MSDDDKLMAASNNLPASPDIDEDKLAAEWAAMETRQSTEPRVLDQDMIDSLLGFDSYRDYPDHYKFTMNIPGYIFSRGEIQYPPVKEPFQYRVRSNSFAYGNIETLFK